MEDSKILLLNFNFAMIYIIHKMLVLFKNYLNYLKENIFKCFFKKYNRLLFFEKNKFFSQHIIMESLNLKEENIIKVIRNFFRLKKKNYITLQLKPSEIFLDKKKKLKQLKIEYLEILRIFLSMKRKKKIIIN